MDHETTLQYVARVVREISAKDSKLLKIIFFFSPVIVYFLLKMFNANYAITFIVLSMHFCIMALLISLMIAVWILKQDTGTKEMRVISDCIEEGSEGFFRE